MPKPPYRLELPHRITTPVIVASPHSGRHYPWSFMRRTVLDERVIRSSEDAFMDILVADAPTLGAPLLAAEYPRAFIDLNRAAEELDPAVVEGVRRASQNPRISSGLGVIPRVVANGRGIYRGKLTATEAATRIAQVWKPYHLKLEELMGTARRSYGEAILLDFHSMPHEALNSVARPGQPRPHVVLGDRFGASSRPEIVETLTAAFTAAGLAVSRNAPFAGAYVTQNYGRPNHGRHVVQIEVDRSLYMDERLIRPNAQFDAIRDILRSAIASVIGAAPSSAGMPLAAE